MMPALGLSGAFRSRRGCRRTWVEPGLGEHRRLGRYELVVLPTQQLLAVSVAEPNGQIIVSQGMVDVLRPEELEVVLGHEVAHLDHGHQRWLVVAAAIDHGLAVFPPARRSVGALRIALERWADESAANERPCRRAALRGALLRVARALVSPAAAFSAADSVMERLDALEAAPPEPAWAARALLYLPGLAVGFVILMAVGASAADARMVAAMAGRCMA
jgi:beta-lactamase regulating signal transducer with metallopeptidase domain